MRFAKIRIAFRKSDSTETTGNRHQAVHWIRLHQGDRKSGVSIKGAGHHGVVVHLVVVGAAEVEAEAVVVTVHVHLCDNVHDLADDLALEFDPDREIVPDRQ